MSQSAAAVAPQARDPLLGRPLGRLAAAGKDENNGEGYPCAMKHGRSRRVV